MYRILLRYIEILLIIYVLQTNVWRTYLKGNIYNEQVYSYVEFWKAMYHYY